MRGEIGRHAAALAIAALCLAWGAVPSAAQAKGWQVAEASAAEIAFWESVQDSDNPAELEAYLKAFPDGTFAALARIRIKALTAGAAGKTESPANEAKTQENKQDGSGLASRQADKDGVPPMPEPLERHGHIGAELTAIPTPTGVYIKVVDVFAGMPAHESGLRKGDEIIKVNNRPIPSLKRFVEDIRETEPGDRIGLTVGSITDNKRLSLAVGDRLKLHWRAAHQGNTDAMLGLGRIFQEGKLLPRDYDKARDWFVRAADAGNLAAYRQLASLHRQTDWSGASPAEARKWLRQGAEKGDPNLQLNLASLLADGSGGFARDRREAVKWYRRAAKAGNAAAKVELGLALYYGRGVSVDNEQAFTWFLEAAEQKNREGQFWTGYLYGAGKGTEKNDQLAVSWYRKAADQGHAQAMTNLGIRYQSGRGVTKSDQAAARWYEKAVAAGHVGALTGLGYMYKHGKGGKSKDVAKAIDLFRQAAAKNNASGYYNLGLMYEKGVGVLEDRAEAIRLYRLAAARDKRADERLKAMKITLYDPAEVQRLLAQAGFDPGPVDGKIGRGTRAAIRDFQRAAGLKVDGEPSVKLVKGLRRFIATPARASPGLAATPSAASSAEASDLNSLD